MSSFAPSQAGVYAAANSSDRTARFPTPFTGQLCYMVDSGHIVRYTGSAWVSREADQTLTDAATIAVDFLLGDKCKVTLGGNRTVGLPTNISTGRLYVFHIIQDGTGGRTLAWNAAFKFGTAWSNTGNTLGLKSTVAFISWDGTTLEQVGSQVAYH